jgi:hypothetical protein
MNDYILICPFAYGFKTRAKALTIKFSCVGLILIPNYLFSFFSSGRSLSIPFFLLAFTALYSAYEIGYIYNDVLTVRHETKSTKWLPENNQKFVNNMYEIMIAARVLWIIIACWILSFNYSLTRIFAFLFILAWLNLFYGFHNLFRDRRNIVTMLLLQFVKYGGLVFLFGQGAATLTYICCGIVEIGVTKTYEYALDKEFIKNKPLIDNVDVRRVAYYLILTVIAVFISYVIEDYGILITTAYMLLFRLICLLLSNIKGVQQDRKKTFSEELLFRVRKDEN